MPKSPPTFTQLLRQRYAASMPSPHVESHARRRMDPAQREADRLRSSARWQHVRALVLAEQPCCEECLAAGRTTAACEVDHVEPIVLRPDLAFVRSNLRSTCAPCHDVKSAKERRARC